MTNPEVLIGLSLLPLGFGVGLLFWKKSTDTTNAFGAAICIFVCGMILGACLS